MPNTKRLLIALALIATSTACTSTVAPNPDPASKVPSTDAAKPNPSPTPTVSASGKAFHISGNIDDAVQEGDVCDTSVAFTVPGTLKFTFTPTSATKGNYTYSGPFRATGSGPYEIFANGKMLVSGTGCIMGKCATYSHDWKATPIGPQACGKTK